MSIQQKTLAPKSLDDWLKVIEAAAELATTEHTVLAHIHSGELAAVNIARPGSSRPSWRIRRSDLEAFLTRRRAVQPLEESVAGASDTQ